MNFIFFSTIHPFKFHLVGSNEKIEKDYYFDANEFSFYIITKNNLYNLETRDYELSLTTG
ncbi:hypothetical protein DERP_008897 [Dermatophagoides pteronyssinus]|uniref:Uncharacterized protein n=1 Tax=Dermatophagoides pteronyssinus TaxID=6956 RepID=A0ABQ8JNB6_DERPT|nr:hypothetical protein DERP_008897 [Dermatophagoides pteronyssinus]